MVRACATRLRLATSMLWRHFLSLWLVMMSTWATTTSGPPCTSPLLLAGPISSSFSWLRVLMLTPRIAGDIPRGSMVSAVVSATSPLCWSSMGLCPGRRSRHLPLSPVSSSYVKAAARLRSTWIRPTGLFSSPERTRSARCWRLSTGTTTCSISTRSISTALAPKRPRNTLSPTLPQSCWLPTAVILSTSTSAWKLRTTPSTSAPTTTRRLSPWRRIWRRSCLATPTLATPSPTSSPRVLLCSEAPLSSPCISWTRPSTSCPLLTPPRRT
mmetsp:Transcript_22790/g.53167  ORF Transcript_22790/g.53167 Transcript_22790/m.53167 type:complete len:270 (+) Transcript_22790:490-1299(+)